MCKLLVEEKMKFYKIWFCKKKRNFPEVIPLLYVNAQFSSSKIYAIFLRNWRRFSESLFSHSTHYSKQHQLSILVQLSEKFSMVHCQKCKWIKSIVIGNWKLNYGVLKVRHMYFEISIQHHLDWGSFTICDGKLRGRKECQRQRWHKILIIYK